MRDYIYHWFTVQAAQAGFGEDTTAQTVGDLIPLRGGSAGNTLALLTGEIIGSLLAFLGAAFLVLMVYGGFMWMTAAGNDTKVKTARKLMLSAVIGVIIILSAYAIVTFVADNVVPQ